VAVQGFAINGDSHLKLFLKMEETKENLRHRSLTTIEQSFGQDDIFITREKCRAVKHTLFHGKPARGLMHIRK
jgi:hypothetical protein